jgi:hypothetical protein
MQKNILRAIIRSATSITYNIISKSINKYQYSIEHSFWGRGLEGKKKEEKSYGASQKKKPSAGSGSTKSNLLE